MLVQNAIAGGSVFLPSEVSEVVSPVLRKVVSFFRSQKSSKFLGHLTVQVGIIFSSNRVTVFKFVSEVGNKGTEKSLRVLLWTLLLTDVSNWQRWFTNLRQANIFFVLFVLGALLISLLNNSLCGNLYLAGVYLKANLGLNLSLSIVFNGILWDAIWADGLVLGWNLVYRGFGKSSLNFGGRHSRSIDMTLL